MSNRRCCCPPVKNVNPELATIQCFDLHTGKRIWWRDRWAQKAGTTSNYVPFSSSVLWDGEFLYETGSVSIGSFPDPGVTAKVPYVIKYDVDGTEVCRSAMDATDGFASDTNFGHQLRDFDSDQITLCRGASRLAWLDKSDLSVSTELTSVNVQMPGSFGAMGIGFSYSGSLAQVYGSNVDLFGTDSKIRRYNTSGLVTTGPIDSVSSSVKTTTNFALVGGNYLLHGDWLPIAGSSHKAVAVDQSTLTGVLRIGSTDFNNSKTFFASANQGHVAGLRSVTSPTITTLIEKVDVSTLDAIWSVTAATGQLMLAVDDDGDIYFGATSHSPDNYQRLAAADGSTVWTSGVGPPATYDRYVSHQPFKVLLSDDYMVAIGLTSTPTSQSGTTTPSSEYQTMLSNIIVKDKSTGNTIWKACSSYGGVSIAVYDAVIVDNRLILVCQRGSPRHPYWNGSAFS